MKKNKPLRIDGVKQEFEILSFDNNFNKIIVEDKKNKKLDMVVLDRSCEEWDLSKIKLNARLICIASKRKIRAYGTKVVTHILDLLPPLQIDLIDYIEEQKIKDQLRS